jgi:hypothetical protein
VKGGIWFGGDYNSEQWDAATWAEDDELMNRARVNTVTVGVFSWALLEPAEGKFEFGWLDDTLAIDLPPGGIAVIRDRTRSFDATKWPPLSSITMTTAALAVLSAPGPCAASPPPRAGPGALLHRGDGLHAR